MEVEYKTRQRALILQFLSDNRERHLSVDEVFDYSCTAVARWQIDGVPLP